MPKKYYYEKRIITIPSGSAASTFETNVTLSENTKEIDGLALTTKANIGETGFSLGFKKTGDEEILAPVPSSLLEVTHNNNPNTNFLDLKIDSETRNYTILVNTDSVTTDVVSLVVTLKLVRD